MSPNRSRGSLFPLFRIRSEALKPPPWRASASFVSKSRTSSSIASDLAVNSGEEVEMKVGSTEA
jgi:hypothetical protein